MSESVQAALQSDDLKIVKKYRGVLKGQLTVLLDKITKILNKKVGEKFNHIEISKSEVKQVGAKLVTNYDLFSKLHEKYCLLRECGKDDEEELELAKKDDEYTEGITAKYFPIQDLLAKYDISLADFEAKEAELSQAPTSLSKLEFSLFKSLCSFLRPYSYLW